MVELRMIEVTLLIRTRMHHCVGVKRRRRRRSGGGYTPSPPAAGEPVRLVLMFEIEVAEETEEK